MDTRHTRGRWHGLGVVLAVAALSLAAGCSSDSADSGGDTAPSPSVSLDIATTPMSDADAAAVDEAVLGVLGSSDLAELAPGTWVGVWDPQRGFFEKAYGDATLDGEQASLDQHLRIGSVTKTFTATAILLLVDQGKIALDDTVEDLLPEVASSYPAYATVTVEQLLGMESGVPDYLNALPPDGLIPALTEDPTRLFTVDEILTAATSGRVEDPGTFGYSSTNFVVLEEIVNAVSGTTLQDFIADEVTGPLGMTDTALQPYEERVMPEPYAHGYATGSADPADLTSGCLGEFALFGGEVAEDADLSEYTQSLTRGAGGIYSTVGDLGIWASSMSGTTLLSEDLQAKRLAITPDVYPPYGLGIMQVENYLGHEGDAFGYQAYALKDPDTGTSVVVMNNTCSNSTLMDEIIAALPTGAAASPATS